jgi:predicted lipoprotein with Yx(FWY)xxD motif
MVDATPCGVPVWCSKVSSASAPGFYAQLEPVVGAVVADENRDGVRVLCARCAAARAATVGVANENLGKLLVDSQGRTLYLFRKGLWNEERVHRRLRNRMAATARDRQADSRRRSDCFDRREQRPFGRKTTGHIQRSPALPFSGDQKPGDTHGEGVNAFDGLWYALSQAGNQIVSSTPNSGISYP